MLLAVAQAQFNGGAGDGYQMTISDILILNAQTFYCSGGNADGHDQNISSLLEFNQQDFYCSGGDADGYDLEASSMIELNLQDFYCSGGNADGYDQDISSLLVFNQQDFYCFGGNADGYDLKQSNLIELNLQEFYCSGGNADGYDQDISSLLEFNQQNFYCNGGNADGYQLGYMQDLLLGIGIWTGLTNSNWNIATNWKYDSVPGIYDMAHIPASCLNYPILLSSLGIDTTGGLIRCRRLEIMDGGWVTTNDSLFINGPMYVAGNYTSIISANNSHKIFNGGELSIPSTGMVRFGSQTSGNGLTDLLIRDGGVLNINGGTLEVDDQVMLAAGGTLNMTDGILIAHKYGKGSAFSAFNRGNFYVANGAHGGISGGSLKICGRESSGGYHAFTILEPSFDFSGNAILRFRHGDYATHYDCGIYAVDGVKLQNLVIGKPGKKVSVKSNLDIEGAIYTLPGSNLEIETGNQVIVRE